MVASQPWRAQRPNLLTEDPLCTCQRAVSRWVSQEFCRRHFGLDSVWNFSASRHLLQQKMIYPGNLGDLIPYVTFGPNMESSQLRIPHTSPLRTLPVTTEDEKVETQVDCLPCLGLTTCSGCFTACPRWLGLGISSGWPEIDERTVQHHRVLIYYVSLWSVSSRPSLYLGADTFQQRACKQLETKEEQERRRWR